MVRWSLAALLALTLAACGQDPNRSVSEEYAAADGKAAYAPMPMAPPPPPMETAPASAIVATGGAVLFALYPALRASRLRPVQALAGR